MQQLVQHPRATPDPTTETRSATEFETEVDRAVDRLAIDIRRTTLSGERHRDGDEITIDISEETDEWTVTLPTPFHYLSVNRPVAEPAAIPDAETAWTELLVEPPEQDADAAPLLDGISMDAGTGRAEAAPGRSHRRDSSYGSSGGGTGEYRPAEELGPGRPEPVGRAPLPVRSATRPDTDQLTSESGTERDDVFAVMERSYDVADDPYGVEASMTIALPDATDGTLSGTLADVFADARYDLDGSVETVTYGVRDEETGEVTEHETTWIDLEGYDMSRGEFFVDGMLADRALDGYDAAAVDTVTYVEAEVFADDDAEICGTDVTLDAALPDATMMGVQQDAYGTLA